MRDITLAPGLMISECASMSGNAKPVTTINAVMKRPRSMGPEPSLSVVKSSEPQCENSALGRGATTKVNAVHAQYHVSDKAEKEGDREWECGER